MQVGNIALRVSERKISKIRERENRMNQLFRLFGRDEDGLSFRCL